MNKLEEINKIMKFKITWKFIKIGYLGYESIQPQITKKDICDYAYSLLEKSSSDFDEIAQLIGEKADDYEFNRILEKLAKHENSNMELQVHKWIIYLTERMISNLDNDYFEGLLNITEFWISLGQPKYAPHIYQGVGNNLMPQEYYNQGMYDLLKNKHKEWLKEEIQKIRKSEEI